MKLQIIQLETKSAIVTFSQDSLDASNVKEFRDQITPWLNNNDVLFLDMSKLSFVDSSGLGALLSCLRTMNGKDGQFRLFGVTKPVLALFELVRMHRLFSIYENVQEAYQEELSHS